jgi:proteic killer suppression protein
MIRSIRSKALKRFWEDGDACGIRPDWDERVTLILDALDQATRPEDMKLPGLKFRELSHDRKGTYAVLVSPNRRITFKWEDGEAVHVDLEDYHGR